MLKNGLMAIAALGAFLCADQAVAQTTTYSFTGGLYTSITPPTNCTVGECARYRTTHRTTVTLTFAEPLAPNLPNSDRSADVTAYTFNDGIRKTTGPGDNASIHSLSFATDASGLPINYYFILERTPGPPYLQNTPAQAHSRVSYLIMSASGTQAWGNAICGFRGNGSSSVSGPGSCALFAEDASTGYAESFEPTVVIKGDINTIPTLSEWAFILFGSVLAGCAALLIHRRRQAA